MVQCDNDIPGVDGDGCNSDCQVEDGYICYGGTSTTPDKCYHADYPEILYVNVTDENNLIVEYSDEVSL